MKYPWKDYSGRTSPLKLAVFLALFAPALWTLMSFLLGWLEPHPFTAAIQQIGLWTIRLIFLALLVTPLLAVVHYCMQSKLDLWEPAIMAGIYFWLIGYRLLARRLAVRGRLPLPWVGALGIVSAAATAVGETAYFWLAFGVDPLRVIAAN